MTRCPVRTGLNATTDTTPDKHSQTVAASVANS
jgi:hypothetical protein